MAARSGTCLACQHIDRTNPTPGAPHPAPGFGYCLQLHVGETQDRATERGLSMQARIMIADLFLGLDRDHAAVISEAVEKRQSVTQAVMRHRLATVRAAHREATAEDARSLRRRVERVRTNGATAVARHAARQARAVVRTRVRTG